MRAEGFLPATAAPWRRCLRLVVHGQVRLDFTPVSDEAAEVGVRHIDDDLPELDGAGRLIDLDAALGIENRIVILIVGRFRRLRRRCAKTTTGSSAAIITAATARVLARELIFTADLFGDRLGIYVIGTDLATHNRLHAGLYSGEP